jgi:Co/Zn/Cd efflux system component
VEKMPDFGTMIFISILALIANGVCLYLLQKSKSKDAHMRASMIFTSNDVIINLGVMLAGLLVFWTDSRFPDLVVGVIVFGLVLFGAKRILSLAK